jgi:hypothetical protein
MATASPEWYEACKQAGFLLSPDSMALAKNWASGGQESGLEEPPWLGPDGEVIEYIGACPPAGPTTQLQLPSAPSLIVIDSVEEAQGN